MDGIEFGQVENREPEPQVRPDRNRLFAVVGCGPVDPEQLPIFVDLYVMRDMEGHARSNLHVELGGVLLGGKFTDENGQPFVVVQEALRAEHYEATRGSFKFTHETWSQITRDRQNLPDELHLVGWYHTHPDWGVFLSGMDTFICDNFFGDDLDVDLVIDPCRGDRGWFFWEKKNGTRSKTRVSGFYLFANRFRRSELLQFADALSQVNSAYFDPRYESPTGTVGGMGDPNMQPVVHIQDQKSPALTIGVLGMLTIQMLVLSLVAWRLLFPPAAETVLAHQQSNEVYRQLLGQMMASGGQDGSQVFEQLEDLAAQNSEFKTDLGARGLLINDLQAKNRKLQQELNAGEQTRDLINQKIQASNETLQQVRQELKAEKTVNARIKEGKSFGGFGWPILLAVAAATGLLGLLGGNWFGRRTLMDEAFSQGRSPTAAIVDPRQDESGQPTREAEPLLDLSNPDSSQD